MPVNWKGVLPAITTPFDDALRVDHAALAAHARWLVDAGCVGIVAGGSLGEASTLRTDEKLAVIATLVGALEGLAPVVASVAASSTAEAVDFTREAEAAGAAGFMVLPPYVYAGDAREMRAHVAAVFGATHLPCMLYNNPLAYHTDFLPPEVVALHADHPHMNAVKESSGNVRRIAWLRSLLPDDADFTILMGVDDLALEAFAAGAEGWIAGLVNAFPEESVALLELARAGRRAEAATLYRWFLPLLRLDIGTKFVQRIKLAQERVGRGPARVRPPRLELVGEEREETLRVVAEALANPPSALPRPA